jgi:hypothetical protein
MPNPNRKGVPHFIENMAKAIFNVSTRKSVPRLLTVTIALTVGLFWLDIRTPADLTVAFLYILPVLCVIFWTPPHQFFPVIVAAILASILNGVGYFWSTDIRNPEMSAVNRLIAACVTWGSVILAMLRKCDEKDNLTATYEKRD